METRLINTMCMHQHMNIHRDWCLFITINKTSDRLPIKLSVRWPAAARQCTQSNKIQPTSSLPITTVPPSLRDDRTK